MSKPEFNTIEDFLNDETFIKWFEKSDSQSELFWEEWMKANPEKNSIVEGAVKVLQFMPEEHSEITDKHIQKAELSLIEKIDAFEKLKLWKIYRNKNIIKLAVAASVSLLLMFGMGYWFVNKDVVYQTAYGESRSIVLPDQSTVVLNSNSKISYPKNWDAAHDREVSLEGEAFFSVKHTINDNKFVVSTSTLNIEVLGTEFNVNNRHEKVNVILNSGKIRLNFKNGTKEILLKPNEKFVSANGKNIKMAVNAESQTSWRQKRLVFDSTPLSEVADIIEDNYGVKVIISTEALASRHLNGSVDINNLDVLLKGIVDLFDVNINRQENTITISEKANTIK